jgi:hypothetical protein
MAKKLLIYNDDGWSSYMRYPAPMSPADVLAATLGPVLGTAVTHYQFCALGGHVVNYTSSFLPRIGEMMAAVDTLHVWRMRETLRGLERLGTDPLRIVSTACREHGIVCQFSLRMNDAHHTYRLPDGSWYFPELQSPWFEAHRDALLPSGQLDYAHPDVHTYRVAQLEEVLERYDVDGVDLDFTRFKPWFVAGREAAGAPLLTELVVRLRELTRARGKTLSARFEYDPQVCIASGLDVERWLAEGWLDQITLGGVGDHTPDAPADWWIERAHRHACVVCPGVEGQLHWCPGSGAGGTGTHAGAGVHDGFGPPSMAYLRAVAANHYRSGADGVSLFNFTCADGPCDPLAFTELATTEALAGKDKQYVVAMWPADAQVYYARWQSRFALQPGQDLAVQPLTIADRLEPGPAAMAPSARLTLDLMGVNRLTDIEISINGVPLTPNGATYNHYDHGCWNEVVQFAVPTICLVTGENHIGLRRLAPTPGFAGAVEVRKCILDLTYPPRSASGQGR